MKPGLRTTGPTIVLVVLALFILGGGVIYWTSPDMVAEAWQGLVQKVTQYDTGRTSDAVSPADGPSATTTITISAVGDVVLGTDSRFDADLNFLAELQRQHQNLGYFFGGVRSVLSQDDLTIANLEGTLTTSEGRSDKSHQDRPFWFKGSPELVGVLSLGSVEAVNLANNHSYDFGVTGYDETMQVLDRAGIGHFGYGDVYTTTIRGVRIALAGFNQLGIQELGTDFDELATEVDATVSRLRTTNDLVIVSFHWGDEFSTLPTEDQLGLAHGAIDAGADLVLGHHPHVIEGVETYRGKQVVYSLGNFVYGGSSGLNDDGHSMIYQQTFTFRNHELAAADYEIVPVLYSSSPDRNDYRPRLAPVSAREAIRRKLLDRTILADYLARGTPRQHVEELENIRNRMAADGRNYDVPRVVTPDEWSTARASSLVDITAVVPGIDYDPVYATPDNVTGKPLYYRDFPYLRVGTARKLAQAERLAVERGYRLRIWDGYRPPEVQWLLWNHTPNANYVASPLDSYSVHNRGGAVDVTLLDENGNEVDMPSGFDDFTSRASRKYTHATPAQVQNARLLEDIMTQAGFETIQTEWWHFADSNRDNYGVIDIHAALATLNFTPLVEPIPPSR